MATDSDASLLVSTCPAQLGLLAWGSVGRRMTRGSSTQSCSFTCPRKDALGLRAGQKPDSSKLLPNRLGQSTKKASCTADYLKRQASLHETNLTRDTDSIPLTCWWTLINTRSLGKCGPLCFTSHDFSRTLQTDTLMCSVPFVCLFINQTSKINQTGEPPAPECQRFPRVARQVKVTPLSSLD